MSTNQISKIYVKQDNLHLYWKTKTLCNQINQLPVNQSKKWMLDTGWCFT